MGMCTEGAGVWVVGSSLVSCRSVEGIGLMGEHHGRRAQRETRFPLVLTFPVKSHFGFEVGSP